MTPETVLALMIALGPFPGRSLYSQVAVEEGAPLVALRTFDVGGKSFQAYDHFAEDEDLPSQCAQPKNVFCRRPRFSGDLKRWERPETFDEALTRYWMIAQSIARNAKTDAVAEYLVTITHHESGWRRDVHAGENHRPKRFRTKHEDRGMSWCLGQVMIGRNPNLFVPWKGYETTKAGDLVGDTVEATNTCLGMVSSRVDSIVRHCGRRGRTATPACVFVGYAGTMIKSTHPLMRARMGTHMKLKAAPPKLHEAWRKLLGLDNKS